MTSTILCVDRQVHVRALYIRYIFFYNPHYMSKPRKCNPNALSLDWTKQATLLFKRINLIEPRRIIAPMTVYDRRIWWEKKSSFRSKSFQQLCMANCSINQWWVVVLYHNSTEVPYECHPQPALRASNDVNRPKEWHQLAGHGFPCYFA